MKALVLMVAWVHLLEVMDSDPQDLLLEEWVVVALVDGVVVALECKEFIFHTK